MFGQYMLPSGEFSHVCERCGRTQRTGAQEVHEPGCPRLPATTITPGVALRDWLLHPAHASKPTTRHILDEFHAANPAPIGLAALVGRTVRWEWVEWPDADAWGNAKSGRVLGFDAGMVLVTIDYVPPRWWPVTAFKWLEAEPMLEPQRRTPERHTDWRSA